MRSNVDSTCMVSQTFMLCLSSSWENYTSLFERVFSVDDDDNNLDRLDLPVQWLWDMVDEFVYQYSDFARFRSKDLKKISLSDDDAATRLVRHRMYAKPSTTGCTLYSDARGYAQSEVMCIAYRSHTNTQNMRCVKCTSSVGTHKTMSTLCAGTSKLGGCL
jgi:hypothetical protein